MQLDIISEIGSQVSSVGEADGFTAKSASDIDSEKAGRGAKADAYDSLEGLPNIHAGLHLWDVTRTVGACRHVHTLLSEVMHKWAKCVTAISLPANSIAC